MNSPLLQISSLNVEFPGLQGNAHVLRNVDLSVRKGEILGLVGESGSGKSMTASTILGLLPQNAIVNGSVKLDGNEVLGISNAGLSKIRGGVAAMIFQNPMRSLNPFFTIGQQMVEIIRLHRNLGGKEARSAAIKELQLVQMPDPALVLTRYPHQLSGGQTQRVMISIALACRPKLLVADEPTTALDVTVQAQIIALIRDLADRKGLTVLFITHDLGVVSTLCDRVATMYAGRIVEAGDVSDVIDNPAHPYTRKLLRTVPEVGAGTTALETIPGQVPSSWTVQSGCSFRNRCDVASNRCASVEPELATHGTTRAIACLNFNGETLASEPLK